MSPRGEPADFGRLAVVVPSLDAGGAERAVVNLLHGFVNSGLRVDLLLVRARGPLLDEVPSEVRVVPLRGGRIIASLPSLVRYLRRSRPAAMLSHLDTMNLVVLAARWLARVSTRVVVTSHTVPSQQARYGTVRQALAVRLLSFAYPHADAVVAVSNGALDDLRELMVREPPAARVIANPIVTDGMRASSEAVRNGSRPPLPGSWAGDDVRIVMSAGRLAPPKNFPLLLEAFVGVRERDPAARLVILGEGPERARLEARIRELGLDEYVHLPGYVRDVGRWYGIADVFVLSSDWEGLPTVLVEALLHGCPVVSTRCPAGPEEILEGGRHGRLVPVGDPAALAAAITATLRAPPDPEPLRRRALEFDVGRATQAYLDVLFPGAKP